jgi:putative nucleotidyltransferase with HDIG domain
MISGLCDLALAVEALKGGATDYLIKPAAPGDITSLVRKHLDNGEETGQARVRDALARFLKARALGNPAVPQLKELFEVLGFKRYETLQHSKRVSEYAKLLGQACQLPAKDLSRLQLGALLHDIGKVAIPRNILFKPTSLNQEEMAIMRLHPSVGWELLSEFPDLEKEAELVYSHHERFDGNGYPRGLQGNQIPLSARIFSIVDTFDAITSDRPYRAALSLGRAREIIVQGGGSQFDGRLAGIFVGIPEETLTFVKQILHEGREEEAEAQAPVAGAKEVL